MEKAEDMAVLRLLAEYRVLTVSQLAELAFVSEQAARRWIRRAEREGWVSKHAGVLESQRGRPEAVLQLGEPGIALLVKSGGLNAGCAPLEARLFRHQLLINAFRIQLGRIEDADLTVTYKRSSPCPMADDSVSQEANGAQVVPDGVFSISSRSRGKSLLFFLEADCSTESLAGSKGTDIRTKVINYRVILGRGLYRKFESLLGAQFRGFRVLFVTETAQRCDQLCRLVRRLAPTDFVWVTDRHRLEAESLRGAIWHRGGHDETESILGRNGNNSASRNAQIPIGSSEERSI